VVRVGTRTYGLGDMDVDQREEEQHVLVKVAGLLSVAGLFETSDALYDLASEIGATARKRKAIATKAAASPVRAARGGAGGAGADAAADSPARASNAMPEFTRPVVDKTECLDRLEGIKTTVGPEHKALKDMIIHATSNSKPLKAFTSAKHDELGVKYAVMLSHNEKKPTVAAVKELGCLLCGNAEQMQEYPTNKGIAVMCTAEHKVKTTDADGSGEDVTSVGIRYDAHTRSSQQDRAGHHPCGHGLRTIAHRMSATRERAGRRTLGHKRAST
jgi:hypothetical protein